MDYYRIEGAVTAWPAGTTEIYVNAAAEAGGSKEELVAMGTGEYSFLLQGSAGEKVWISFFAFNGTDNIIAANKTFGPFIIDDIGVLD